MVKNSPTNAGDTGDTGSIPGLERYLGEESGNSLQYSYLENSMDRGTWQATVQGVRKESDTAEHTHRAHNTSSPHIILFFFLVVRTFKIQSLINFQVYKRYC